MIVSQLQKKLVHMGALVRYEKPRPAEEAALTGLAKRESAKREAAFNRSVQNTLFSVQQYLRVVSAVSEQLSQYKTLQALQQMVRQAKDQS